MKIPWYLKLVKKLPRAWRCPRFSDIYMDRWLDTKKDYYLQMYLYLSD